MRMPSERLPGLRVHCRANLQDQSAVAVIKPAATMFSSLLVITALSSASILPSPGGRIASIGRVRQIVSAERESKDRKSLNLVFAVFHNFQALRVPLGYERPDIVSRGAPEPDE